MRQGVATFMEKQPIPKNEKNKELYLTLLCYLTVYFVWGSTYLFIKLAVETIPPFYVIGLRFFAGGLFFILFSLFTGRFKRFPRKNEILASIFLGVFLLLGGNGLVTFAEKKVDSYIAALIISTTPVIVAFFDRVFIKKKISLYGLLGIFAGILGVSILLYTGSTDKSELTSFSPEMLMVVGGLISWAFATSLGHKIKVFPDVFINSGIQMISVGIICLIILFFTGPSINSILPTVTLQSAIGLFYLAIIGSAAFCAYNYLIHHEPAIKVVSYAFVNPMIAIFLGLIIAKEKPVPYLIPGVALILIGLFLMLYGDLILKKKAQVIFKQSEKNT
jgi:drug/metabolite transporter (DMT)-like permease